MHGAAFNHVEIGYMFNRTSSQIPRIGLVLWVFASQGEIVNGATGSGSPPYQESAQTCRLAGRCQSKPSVSADDCQTVVSTLNNQQCLKKKKQLGPPENRPGSAAYLACCDRATF